MLDYIITHISGHYMNGVDYGAIGGFMLYRILQGSIRRIMYKVEKVIVLYIAIFIGFFGFFKKPFGFFRNRLLFRSAS